MPAPTSTDELLDLVRKSGVLDESRLQSHLQKLRESGELPDKAAKLAAALVQDGLLTNFQAEQLVQGKWRRFMLGKYKVLERLGSGGMGSVFLCEHILMRRRVAVKVLPTAKAVEPSCLERFYREARAVAAVDHPNIVHAYDIDKDESLHFIVMEFIDGPSLQELVQRSGPLGVERACHYISQSANGLSHASKAGLVHRDIKPGNILVDRAGVVKILDMGLARFFNDEDDLLSRKYDENVLGTADYLAPEQADDSHVDVRADIYSLGGTFYYLLTGKTPFGEGTVPQKLMWQRTRRPKPISAFRADVPAELHAVIDKMMAKELEQRYQTPDEIVAALARWTQQPIAPPTESEMPRFSPAAAGSGSTGNLAATPFPGASGSGVVKKTWQVAGAATPPSKSSPPSGGGSGQPAPALQAFSGNKSTDEASLTKQSDKSTPAKDTAKIKKTTQTSTSSRPAAGSTTGKKGARWSSAAPDTVDAAARGDTPPLVPTRQRTRKRPASILAKAKSQPMLLIAAAGVLVVLGLLGLVTLGMILFARH